MNKTGCIMQYNFSVQSICSNHITLIWILMILVDLALPLLFQGNQTPNSLFLTYGHSCL